MDNPNGHGIMAIKIDEQEEQFYPKRLGNNLI
jgi:hypothetical protein